MKNYRICCRYKKCSGKEERSTIKSKEIKLKLSLKEVRFSWLEGRERDKSRKKASDMNKDSDIKRSKHMPMK